MQVNCQKVSPIVCAGTVELQRAAKPLLKLGKKTFSVKKGTKALRVDQALRPRALDPAQEQDDAGEGDRARQDEHEDDQGLARDDHAQGDDRR